MRRLLYSAEDVNGRVMFLTAAFGVAVNVAMAVLLSEHHSHGLPGQACSHNHSHEHAHGSNSYAVLPSPNKTVRSGYGLLEPSEEPTAAKDSFVEMKTVALSAAANGDGAQHVAVVVHRHDGEGGEPTVVRTAQGAHTTAGHTCSGHHLEAHRHEHPPSSTPPKRPVAQLASAARPQQQHQHAGEKEAHAEAAHHNHPHSHSHPPSEPHSHPHSHSHSHPNRHSHIHSCGHKEQAEGHGHREAPASATEEAAGGHDRSEADAFTPLFSPLQLLSDAPAYLAGKLDPAFSSSEGPGGAHVHSETGCTGGAHGHAPRKQNINLRGAFVHVVGDLVQSVGVMVAGAIIWARPDW